MSLPVDPQYTEPAIGGFCVCINLCFMNTDLHFEENYLTASFRPFAARNFGTRIAGVFL